MNLEETKYTSDQCLPGANNKATITKLSENLRWLMLNISAGMPDFRLRTGGSITACRPSCRTLSDSPDSNRPKRTIDDDNQVIITLPFKNKR